MTHTQKHRITLDIEVHIDPDPTPPPEPPDPQSLLDGLTLEEVTRRHVARVLAKFGGRRDLACQSLGLSERTLYRWLRQWSRGDQAVQTVLAQDPED